MKILASSQLRAADAYTIEHEPIASIDLMERASAAFTRAFLQRFPQPGHIAVFCGTGNNGGDGLVIARLLHLAGWNVSCYLIAFLSRISADNETNQKRWEDLGQPLHSIRNIDDLPEITAPFILDALVGTGITRPLEGLLRQTVQKINQSGATVCAVDMPSGLFDQGDCTEHLDAMIHANETFTFQAPKRNFLLPEYAMIVGNWSVLDIGLDKDFIAGLDSTACFVDAEMAAQLLQPRPQHAHKGTFGHAGIVAGSYGMLGAAILATKACLRSSAGLTTIHVPDCGYSVLQSCAPEAMCVTAGEYHLKLPVNTDKYTALGVGPGVGRHTETTQLILELLKRDVPLILDADALNCLSEQSSFSFPVNTIITPHQKEFERLFGATNNSEERLERAKKAAEKHTIYIVLKGHFTQIICPDGSVYFNSTGNPGMATGGSGDVLTGIITGLRAQKYPPQEACVLGCFLHGLAGDLAAKHKGQHAMIASDIIEHLPEAFQTIAH